MARSTTPPRSGALASLLWRNRAWAARKLLSDPEFFHRLSEQQRPAYFWIGCSDSRVPATEIVDLDPGEMFVHRNVANLAVAGDPSFEAALAFAVDVLSVRHIIVTGHYCCGGIRAAKNPHDDVIGRWLAGPHALYQAHARTGEPPTEDRLCELNVLDQVERLSIHPTVTTAWRVGRDLTIHGWIYSIANGQIAELREPVVAHEMEAHDHA